MKHKILLLLFLFSLLPSWGWGQENEVTETINLEDHEGGYTIEQNGTYTFKGTYRGNPTQEIGNGIKAVIKVNADLDVTIILDNVQIDLSDRCPLCAKDASKVNLLLKGTNTLKGTGFRNHAIWTPCKSGSEIIIDEEPGSSGLLTAYTNGDYPAIGSAAFDSKIQITIAGGIVNASSYSGPGIGTVGIDSESKIIITGGIVNASSSKGSGIGSGYPYTSGRHTFSTGKNGTAFINANGDVVSGGITDKSYIQQTTTSGIIFDNNKTGTFYGSSVTLANNVTLASNQLLTISDDQTLTIAKGATLTIAPEATLTNNGTIKCDGEINGTIGGDKKVQYAVTYDPNYNNLSADHIEYVESGGLLPTYNVNRKYYEFDGWYDNKTDGAEVTIINQSTTVYAHWKKNEIKVVTTIPNISSSVGTNNFQAYKLDNLLEESSYKEGITYNWFDDLEEHYGLDIKLNQITGTPDKVTKDNANIKIKISGENCEDQVVDIPIKIEKGNVMIDMTVDHNCIYSGKVVDIEIPVYNHSIKEIGKASLVYYLEESSKTTPENSGATCVGGAPKFAGEYGISAKYLGDDNYLKLDNNRIKLIISQKELNIIPKSNQKLFEGETPAYEVTGEVNDENPEFTGSLGVESGKVVINSLALTTEFAQNYSLSITPDIPITIINNETVKSLVQLNGTTNANGAYIDEVTFTAPEGFLIALESSKLKSSLNYSKSFTWNQKGTYDLNYKLKRISDGEESKQFSMEITVVESHYIPDNGGNDNNDSSITEYNIEIPEVEGISIDEGFGDHWIKDWKDFSFIITVKEGYVENSDPEVTIKGYDFEFDALTDTTYECKIDHVYKNAEVTITGIVKDPPATANNAIKAPEKNWKIINGVAYITVAKPTVFAVVDMNGNIISTNKLAPGVTPIYDLPRAKPIVFWFDKERAEKVIIK